MILQQDKWPKFRLSWHDVSSIVDLNYSTVDSRGFVTVLGTNVDSSDADAVRYPGMTIAQLREYFLLGALFQSGKIQSVYVDLDRTVSGSAVSLHQPLALPTYPELRPDLFTERRELGVLDIGEPGKVRVRGGCRIEEQMMKLGDNGHGDHRKHRIGAGWRRGPLLRGGTGADGAQAGATGKFSHHWISRCNVGQISGQLYDADRAQQSAAAPNCTNTTPISSSSSTVKRR